MRRLLLGGLAVLWTVSSGLLAQAADTTTQLPDTQHQELRQQMELYKSRLNLSATQEAQVEEINRQYLEGLRKLKNADGPNLGRLRKFKQLSDGRDAKMKAVLSPGQYNIYTRQKEQAKKQAMAGRRP